MAIGSTDGEATALVATIAARAGRGIAAAFRRMAAWDRKRRSRMALAELTDDELADIGVSRAEALKEAAKATAFWR